MLKELLKPIAGIVRITNETQLGAHLRREEEAKPMRTKGLHILYNHRVGLISTFDATFEDNVLEQQYKALYSKPVRPNMIVSVAGRKFNFPQFTESKDEAISRQQQRLDALADLQDEMVHTGLNTGNAQAAKRVERLQQEYDRIQATPVRLKYGILVAGVPIPLGSKRA